MSQIGVSRRGAGSADSSNGAASVPRTFMGIMPSWSGGALEKMLDNKKAGAREDMIPRYILPNIANVAQIPGPEKRSKRPAIHSSGCRGEPGGTYDGLPEEAR